MEKLLDKIRQVVEPIIDENDVELVDLEVKGSKRQILIRVFVDEPGGISINRCAKLSRQIEDAFEIENFLLSPNYRLEVSSPGIDRPLKSMRDFQRNIGRLVEIQYTGESEEKPVSVRGDIINADEASVTILTKEKEEKQIALDRIQKALIQIKWS